MQTLRQDIVYALRQMRLSPVFTLTAMLTLAIGIGATTAIFSLINTVMLQSLPVDDPGSLYRIGTAGTAASRAVQRNIGACSRMPSTSRWRKIRRSSNKWPRFRQAVWG